MQDPFFCCFALFLLFVYLFFNFIILYSTSIAWTLLDKRKKEKSSKKIVFLFQRYVRFFYKFLKHKNLYIIVRETVYIDYIHIYLYHCQSYNIYFQKNSFLIFSVFFFSEILKIVD